LRRRINLSFVQFAPRFGEVDQNLDTAFRLAKRAKSGIIVFPELFNTGYAFTSREEVRKLAEPTSGGRTCDALLQLSKRITSTIVAGFAESHKGHLYNSSIIVSKGKFLGVYRKLHLFHREKTWFNPGNLGLRVIDHDGVKIGMMICFDWIFPEVARTLTLQGAEVIAHPANLILPELSQTVMRARSVENMVFTITANRVGRERRGGVTFRYTGLSQIVSPKMKILARAGDTDESVQSVNADLNSARKKIIFGRNHILKERRVGEYSEILKES
jgi:predicted amidohydrolase